MNLEENKLIKEVTEEVLDILEVPATIEVEENNEGYKINLHTEAPGLLIGYHGKTLNSLQTFLSVVLFKKIKEKIKILVDVNDYRQKREEVLKRMALSAARKVRFSRKEEVLPPMPAFERKIIHLVLANEEGVETESQGEGKERRVVVKPKK
ncbi:MAG: protein jag [Microgenomates group bacterium]